MDIKSLGYRTDLVFARFDAQVVDHGRHISVCTPTNPEFFWGNFLLFDSPPTAGCMTEWQELLDEEVGHPDVAFHYAFGWDTIDGDCGEIQQFLDAGYLLDENVVLATDRVVDPPHHNHDVVIRPFSSRSEWGDATVNKIETRDKSLYSLYGYSAYMSGQMACYRRMVDAGLGQWFGAFIGDRLVADLGVFRDGDIARYQHVDTHPDFRRRGICGTLVYESARWAQQNLGVKTLVMIADEHYHAARIYESVGFKPVENIRGVTWWKHAT